MICLIQFIQIKILAFRKAIQQLKSDNLRYSKIHHRQIKYLNNRLESDHGKLKRLINPMLGFKTMKSANTTIMGYEIMRLFKKGQFKLWTDLYQKTEQEFIHYLFDLAS